MQRSQLAAGACLILGIQPLAAQSVGRPKSNTEPVAALSGESSAGEIIVTAQRRSERLVDVPMSVTALSANQLTSAGAATTQDLTLVTPGLLVARSSAFVQPTIRGIGSRNSGPGDEPNVSIFIDGVYQPEQSATLFELADIERVEVLKGPQGTLFGRNATGGAINIITRRPGGALTANASASYGRYNYAKGTAYLSGDLNQSGTLAASISAVGVRDDGYIRNIYLNETTGYRKAYATRAKLLFAPTSATEFQLNGFYSYNSDNSTFSGEPYGGSTIGRRAANPTNIPANIAFPTEPRQTATNFIPFDRVRTAMADGHAKTDVGFADLSILLSYERTRGHTLSDLDVSALPSQSNEQFIRAHSYDEEAYLTSPSGGRFNWIAGVSAMQGNSFFDPQIINGASRSYGQYSTAVSGFVEGTYEIFDHLFLTGGGRYSKDRKRSSYDAPGVAHVGATANFHDFSPRAVLRWEIAPGANLYASYSEGYKTGTFNAGTVVGATIAAQPERVRAYEIGGKARLGRDLDVTAAAFHYSYTNLQTTVFATVNGVLSGILQNAPAAKVDGVELSAIYHPTHRLNLNAGLSLLRSKITDFPNASINVPSYFNGLPAGNTAVSTNIAGNQLIRAPRRTINIGGSYRVDLGRSHLSFDANAMFSSKYYIELGNRIAQPAYEIVNGSITFTLPGDHFSIGVFGQNLTNQVYFQGNTISTIADTVSYAKPRWFGVTVSAKY